MKLSAQQLRSIIAEEVKAALDDEAPQGEAPRGEAPQDYVYTKLDILDRIMKSIDRIDRRVKEIVALENNAPPGVGNPGSMNSVIDLLTKLEEEIDLAIADASADLPDPS